MKKVLSYLILALTLNSFAQQISVAVLPSDGDEAVFNNDDLEALTNKMRSVALKTLPSETFSLLTQEVVIKRLGGAENFIKECRESSCIVDLGKKAQVDYVAQASVGKLRDKMRIKVEVYEVSSSRLVGMYDGGGDYFDDYFVLLKAIDENVSEIFKKIPGPQYVSPISPVVPMVSNVEQKEIIERLIKRDLKENKEKIQRESSNLSPNERDILYDDNRKKYAAAWGWLNFYGIGSFLQGDIKGGIIVAGPEIVGVLFLRREKSTAAMVLVCGGYLYGIIAPLLYQSSYNKTLREALNVENISFSIDPIIVPKNGPPAVGLAFNLRY